NHRLGVQQLPLGTRRTLHSKIIPANQAPSRQTRRPPTDLFSGVLAPAGAAYTLFRWYAGASLVYAIGTIAAAAFAALLYKVVTGGAVTAALTDLVQQALSVKF